MTELSDKAFAIMAVCEETQKTFGITVDYISQRHYKFVWTFKVDKGKAHREGYDSKTVTGSVELDPNYPGCPSVEVKNFIYVVAEKLFVITANESLHVQNVDK